MTMTRKLMGALSALLLVMSCAGGSGIPQATFYTGPIEGQAANLGGTQEIHARFRGIPEDFDRLVFRVEPDLGAVTAENTPMHVLIRTEQAFELGTEYTLFYTDPAFVDPDDPEALPQEVTGSVAINVGPLQELWFNELYSDKPLGYNLENGQSVFRLFVPRGRRVLVHIFDRYDDETASQVLEMTPDENMVFEASVPGTLWGKFYGYQIVERTNTPGTLRPDIPHDTIFADPYSMAVASTNVYPSVYRSLIYNMDGFNWQGVESPAYDISDLVIMETHVRDLTASPTAGTPNPGTFNGMLNATRGGLNYLREVGVNAVEFLPLHEFNNIEAPFGEMAQGIRNNWNAFSQNYWGYMTNNFFAVESYFATDGTLDPTRWSGTQGRSVNEFRTMVREFHRNGIAVLMDVVYNHVSGYDENALKIIDMEYYFRPQDRTGTGTEVESRRRMVRRMIIDSLKHFVTQYRVDGFRFDLAASHDPETVQAIYRELREVNPNVYLIAEPWGGAGLTNAGMFLQYGWSKWNADIRDVIRGQNRPTTPGNNFALGNNNNAAELAAFWGARMNGGEAHQFVQYIESHDDATLGDNLRVMSGFYRFTEDDGQPFSVLDENSFNRIIDLEAYLTLPPNLLNAHRVAATALFLAQGPIMIHVGQEWARGKVQPDLSDRGITEVTNKGRPGASSDNVIFNMPTPNTYSADTEVNWINFDHVALNQELFDFYAGLIRLRRSQPLLGSATPDQIEILNNDNRKSLGTNINNGEILGFVNADPNATATYEIPEGTYSVVLDATRAGTEEIREISGTTVEVAPASGLILIRK